MPIVNGIQQGLRILVVRLLVKFVLLKYTFHFFGLLENVVCAVFRPLYQEICFTCKRVKIAVIICNQHNHRFERCFQFRLGYKKICLDHNWESYYRWFHNLYHSAQLMHITAWWCQIRWSAFIILIQTYQWRHNVWTDGDKFDPNWSSHLLVCWWSKANTCFFHTNSYQRYQDYINLIRQKRVSYT